MNYRYLRQRQRHELPPIKTQNAPLPSAVQGPPAIQALNEARTQLAKKITSVKNRLAFSYSDPLHVYYMQLITEDLDLCKELSDLLIQLPKAQFKSAE